MPAKLIYLVLAVLCLMLGVIGLIIPVIPGLLFLAAAVYLLGRVSVRVKRWSDSQPMLNRVNRRLDQMGEVSFAERAKVAGLMTLEFFVAGLAAMANAGRNLMQRFSRSERQF